MAYRVLKLCGPKIQQGSLTCPGSSLTPGPVPGSLLPLLSSLSLESCDTGPRSVPMSIKDQKAQACDLPKATAGNTETQTERGQLLGEQGPLPPCSGPGLSRLLPREG